MIFTRHAISVLGLAVVRRAMAQGYFLKDTFRGRDFFSWTWETSDDPTHGRVNYIDKPSAQSSNLSYASDNKFIMRVDATNIVPLSARGRDSNRITSMTTYNDSLMVLQLTHMPVGCATWPAFWTLSARGPWPKGGEIDIIEGVHLATQNLASLHTDPDCAMPPTRKQGGTSISSDCDAAVNHNQGCGTSFRDTNSYGAGFNNQGGGWFVMERSRNKGISLWYWPRSYVNVPLAIRECSEIMEPDSTWGDPEAYFPTGSCDYDSHFDAHRIIFDTTLCGDWAGATFPQAGCGPGCCNDYVDNNPENFWDAYWEIDSLCVYTPPS